MSSSWHFLSFFPVFPLFFTVAAIIQNRLSFITKPEQCVFLRIAAVIWLIQSIKYHSKKFPPAHLLSPKTTRVRITISFDRSNLKRQQKLIFSSPRALQTWSFSVFFYPLFTCARSYHTHDEYTRSISQIEFFLLHFTRRRANILHFAHWNIRI